MWDELPSCVSIVPRLHEWEFNTNTINDVMDDLKLHWSFASEWFMDPEWIVIFHEWSRQVYKKTFDHDEWKRSKK